MGNFEELFETTYRKMRAKVGAHIPNKNKSLEEIIRKITIELETELKRYRVSGKVCAQIETKLIELKGKMAVMNEGKASRLVQDCVRDLENEKENLQEDTKTTYSKLKGNAEERRDKNKEAKDNAYINDCTRQAFDDIRRNIKSYVETYGIPSRIMRSGDFEKICNSIVMSYRKCTVGLKTIHDTNIDEVTEMLVDEVDRLCEDINREDRKQEKAANVEQEKGVLGEKRNELNADFFDNPWALDADKKAEINKNSVKIAKQAEQKSEEPKESEYPALPDDFLL